MRLVTVLANDNSAILKPIPPQGRQPRSIWTFTPPKYFLNLNQFLPRAANLDLFDIHGKPPTPYWLMKLTVAALAEQHVMVILNNHCSTMGWCCSVTDGKVY
jgi:hypothetical protein